MREARIDALMTAIAELAAAILDNEFIPQAVVDETTKEIRKSTEKVDYKQKQ